VTGVNGNVATGAESARRTFVLTFDFEDWHQLVHRRLGLPDWREGSVKFEDQMAAVLRLLDELGVKATFFVVGIAAECHPRALESVVARGHDIACHGYHHEKAYHHTPEQFKRDVNRSLEVIERLSGHVPIGYRAPSFSITRSSQWAFEIVRELGFRYDSSLYDSPLVPRRIRPIPSSAFRLAERRGGDGLWEFPIAAWRWRNGVVPVGGGSYWRALPSTLLWHGLENAARRSPFPVLYFHPYECGDERLGAVLPTRATPRQRVEASLRGFYRNTHRDLVPARIREASQRFRLVTFRDVLNGGAPGLDASLLRQARQGV
jgi:polysaccharide deacetylase family protein (PEP-CTERM system associated)